jgi:hypothetical protein
LSIMDNLFFEPLDHGEGGNSRRIIGLTEDLFCRQDALLLRVRELAAEVSGIVSELDRYIERHTASACPDCRNVCCINRHSYHTHEDLVYILALREKVPDHDLGVAGTDPCEFLGKRGCAIRRSLRPHRCNSYFCAPLLELMEKGNAREYRRFVAYLKRLTDTRMEMLYTFAHAAGEAAKGHTGPVASRPNMH